ncbi:MAG: hypothetical protein RLZZ435_2040 [Cyanobacteriota bacterium]
MNTGVDNAESMNNPALKEYSRNQNAPVLPSLGNASILDWLETTGRLLARDKDENQPDYLLSSDEEIEGLMVDESSYEDSDDDDEEFDLEE